METNTFTHAGKSMADLLAENAQLREIEAANKETIEYWRRQCYKLEKRNERLLGVLEKIIQASCEGDCYCELEVVGGGHAIECPVAIAGIAREGLK